METAVMRDGTTPPTMSTVEMEILAREALRARGVRLYRDFGKRVLDCLLVLFAAPAVVLLVAMVAPFIMRDGGPLLYRQSRVGRGGRHFTMWKLRSMVPDADDLLAAHLTSDALARAEWERSQKLRNDPRITRIGRFIRTTSIDELPQLWNVLVGDMSLVGPRPMMPDQIELYPGVGYYALRPGITGYWQTSVRNEASFAQRADFDTRYLRDLSLMTDLKMLTRTVRVVLRGTGY